MAGDEIAAPYSALMNHLDHYQFKNNMRAEPSLWLPESQVSQSTEQMLDEQFYH